jgi:hypothetical protein
VQDKQKITYPPVPYFLKEKTTQGEKRERKNPDQKPTLHQKQKTLPKKASSQK